MTGNLTTEPTQDERSYWWQILLAGTLLYFTGMAILVETGNPVLFPLVIILGSFTVPAGYVAFVYERRGSSKLQLSLVILSFLYGGILGAFPASLLEPLFASQHALSTALAIGFVEEFAKIIGVLLIANHYRHTSAINGLILGAAAGLGFAAFESTGYTFVVFLQSHGNPGAIMEVTVLRGLLAPIAHGTWTAILGAILFGSSAPGHFQIGGRVLAVYVLVAVLHGLWDGLAFISPMIGFVPFLPQLGVGVISLLILGVMWTSAKNQQGIENDMTIRSL